MSDETKLPETIPAILIHENRVDCRDGNHDWSGPGYERQTQWGGFESGATCAKCGMEFGHFALFTFD